MKRRGRVIVVGISMVLLLFLVVYALVTRRQARDIIRNTPENIQVRIDEETAEGRFFMNPAELDLPYEDVTVTNASGMHLYGWYIPSENGAVVMLQHGWLELPYHMLEEAEMLHRHGYGALLTTVRAHNFSDGETVSFGCHEMEDLDAWYNTLLDRPEVDDQKIGILGQSMGGSLVIQYAHQNENIKAVVTHSAFSSMPDVFQVGIKNNFPGIPDWFAGIFRETMVFWLDNILDCDIKSISAKTWIADISPRPVLVIDAEGDTTVNEDAGELLLEAAGEPVGFWQCPGSDHHQCDTDYPQEFEERVVGFFDRVLLGER